MVDEVSWYKPIDGDGHWEQSVRGLDQGSPENGRAIWGALRSIVLEMHRLRWEIWSWFTRQWRWRKGWRNAFCIRDMRMPCSLGVLYLFLMDYHNSYVMMASGKVGHGDIRIVCHHIRSTWSGQQDIMGEKEWICGESVNNVDVGINVEGWRGVQYVCSVNNHLWVSGMGNRGV